MNICFLGDSSSVHIKRWCEFFRDKGDKVSLIGFGKDNIEGIQNICLNASVNINSNGGNIGYLKKINFIRKIIKEIDPDIVNAHYLTSYGFIGAITKQKPLVVSTWGSDILVTPFINIGYKLLTKYVINKSNLMTSDSRFMTGKIYELVNTKGKVLTVPMGIDPTIFKSTGNEISKTGLNILSVRTLTKNSNIDIIIKAFHRLLQEKKDITLIITNSGDKELELKQLVNKLDISNSVKFLGSIKKQLIADLLRNSDLYISIPTSDSTSVSLLEAMACGILPIVSNLPANEEWIINGKNGCVINNMDEELLFNVMKNTLKDEIFKIEAAKLNKDIINDRAIWNENMNYIRDEYMKLISCQI